MVESGTSTNSPSIKIKKFTFLPLYSIDISVKAGELGT
jgi:hypothetical protein